MNIDPFWLFQGSFRALSGMFIDCFSFSEQAARITQNHARTKSKVNELRFDRMFNCRSLSTAEPEAHALPNNGRATASRRAGGTVRLALIDLKLLLIRRRTA